MMDCGSVDLKGFSLGEASPAEKRVVESHIKACGSCRDELARLELTFASLGALRDEEIPKRIAFVSDKVFEPSWWQRVWNSGPQLGFASAGMLAAALVFHGVYQRPVPVPVSQAALSSAPTSATSPLSDEQIQKRIDDAVFKAVAQVEARQQQKTVELLQASEKKNEIDRQGLLMAFEDQSRIMQSRMNQMVKVTAGLN